MRAKIECGNFKEVREIEETLCAGNCVFIHREENKYDSSGVAFRISCKDKDIGFLPDLKTLRKGLKTTKGRATYDAIMVQGIAVKTIRDSFNVEFEVDDVSRWIGKIFKVSYSYNRVVGIEITFPVEVF